MRRVAVVHHLQLRTFHQLFASILSKHLKHAVAHAAYLVGFAITSDLLTSRASNSTTSRGRMRTSEPVFSGSAHTASAASRLQPPANTDNRSKRTRSSGSSKS